MKQALAKPLEILMIPGGSGAWPLLNEDADPEGVAALLDWVRRMDSKVKLMTSMCTGAAVCCASIKVTDSGNQDDAAGSMTDAGRSPTEVTDPATA
jgi:putative intracellular protease/amidase